MAIEEISLENLKNLFSFFSFGILLLRVVFDRDSWQAAWLIAEISFRFEIFLEIYDGFLLILILIYVWIALIENVCPYDLFVAFWRLNGSFFVYFSCFWKKNHRRNDHSKNYFFSSFELYSVLVLYLFSFLCFYSKK